MEVYKAIAEVALAISKEGVSKNQSCSFNKTSYKFRGIDDIYNALAPIMAKAELVMLPRVLSRTVSERVAIKEYAGSRTESVTFYVTIEVEYDFISAKDGSKHTIKVFGEAMDTGDKATNKAMSAAYKYACFQTFCIPTEGDNDADATNYKVVAKDQTQSQNDEQQTGQTLILLNQNDVPIEFKRVGDWLNTYKSLLSTFSVANIELFEKIKNNNNLYYNELKKFKHRAPELYDEIDNILEGKQCQV